MRSASDARLTLGMGADRVVIDAGDPEITDPLGTVHAIAQAVGPDGVSVAVTVRRVAATHTFAWERCLTTGEGTGQDAITFLVELARLGAGELVLIPSFQGQLTSHPSDLVERLSTDVEVQLVSLGAEKEPADLAAPLLMGADAVATSTLFCDGSVQVADIKAMLREYGVAVRPAVPPYIQPR